ncbi:MAG: hypothetical protein A2Y12_02985 [Planctomycetes bacterium GWF2_42_9]|nr:MAG: hypothetical protein A2Y12_02985 [Planctomycetes bacterium GWF2_42_9]HAL44391.1 hypothetical protein [Phycisphaerales bacterium]
MRIKTFLSLYLFALIFALGCQPQTKPPSLVEDIKTKQEKVLRNSIVASCEDCYSWLDMQFTDRDIVIARNPGIEEDLYLTVLDDEGVPVTCCKKSMQLRVDPNGKLFLYCKSCGNLKPIAVKDGKVFVVQEEDHPASY